MKTNKMGHFVCGVLATYGLVVACGNMIEEKNNEGETITPGETNESNGEQSCLSKLYKKK